MGISISNQLLGSTGLSVGLGLSRGGGLYFAGFGGATPPPPPPFTPASLFTSGAPGFLLDATLTDLSSLFQDSAGTTPVTAVEQSVGLALDDAQNAVGTNGAKRVNLLNWTEAFNNAAWTKFALNTTGTPPYIDVATDPYGAAADLAIPTAANSSHTNLQTVSVAAGAYTYSRTVKANGYNYYGMQFALTGAYAKYFEGVFNLSTGVVEATGRAVSYTGSRAIVDLGGGWYRCSITITNADANAASIVVDLPMNTNDPTITFAGDATSGVLLGGADFRLTSEASTAPTPYQPITSSWAATMAGNHFVQSTSAARPVLSARVNLHIATEDLANAYWSATSGQASRVTSAGFTTFTENTSTSTHSFGKTSVFTNAVGAPITIVQSFKAGTRRYVQVQWDNGTQGVAVVIDTQNWTITPVTGGGTVTASSITNLGAGEYQVALTGFVTSGSTAVNHLIYGLGSSTQNDVNYLGTGATIIASKADIRVANDTASPVYQRVNTATDYATTGFPIYLRYDGTDDFLVSAATVNFSTTAQMSVFAGVRKITDPAGTASIILELSNAATNNRYSLGGFLTPSTRYFTASGGTLLSGNDVTSAAFSAPISNVLTGLADITSDLNQLRINGGLQASSTADQGTGNYPDALTYIGRRGGTTLPFNGRIYFPLVTLGRTATATEIANMESYLSASMGGGYVPTGYDFLVTGDGDQLTDASGNALYTIPLYS